jgi:hypothetical protein
MQFLVNKSLMTPMNFKKMVQKILTIQNPFFYKTKVAITASYDVINAVANFFYVHMYVKKYSSIYM